MTKFGIQTRWALLTVLSIVAVAVAPLERPPAVAQDAASSEMKNLLIVSLSGYDNLLADVGFLGQFVGQPALAEQLTKTLELYTQGQGLPGLDKSRPWGMVVQTDGTQFQPLAFAPVTDVKQLLGALENLQLEAQDRGAGVFELQSTTPAVPQSVFVKQSGDWAFIGQNADAVAQVPADPVAQLDGLHQQYDVAVRLYVQNIPELFRQMAIG